MDTEVEEPPDQLTKHPAFECFSRMIKIEVKKLLPNINDQVLDKHALIKWKQASHDYRAEFETMAAREAVMCKEVKKEVKQVKKEVKQVKKEVNDFEQEKNWEGKKTHC